MVLYVLIINLVIFNSVQANSYCLTLNVMYIRTHAYVFYPHSLHLIASTLMF